MKKSEEQVIFHCIGLMEALTNYTPVMNENSKFLIVNIGHGDHQIKVAYNKQTATPETDMDNIQMSAYVQCAGLCMQYFTQGKLPVIVTRWDQAKEEDGDEG